MQDIEHEPWLSKQAAEQSVADFVTINDPHNGSIAYMILGLIHGDLGDLEGGIEILRQGRNLAAAANEAMLCPALSFYICSLLRKQGDSAALDEIDATATSLLPWTHVPAICSSGHYLRGVHLQAEGKLEAAEAEILTAYDIGLFFKPLLLEALALCRWQMEVTWRNKYLFSDLPIRLRAFRYLLTVRPKARHQKADKGIRLWPVVPRDTLAELP